MRIFNYFLYISFFFIVFSTSFAQEFQWAVKAGGISADVYGKNDTDSEGNVYSMGNFQGTINISGTNITSLGGTDLFFAKYNSDGGNIWGKRIGGGTLNEGGIQLKVNSSNEIIIGGWFGGSVDFGGGNVFTTIGGVQNDITIAKYNSDGNLLWVKRFGSDNFDRVFDLKLDSEDNIIFTGIFRNTISFDTINLTSLGSDQIYIAKIDTDGNVLWAKRGGTSVGNDYGIGIAIDSQNNVYATGFYGNADAEFGGSTLSNEGGDDIFLVKYNSSGVFQWAKHYGSTASDRGRTLVTDDNDNIYLGAFFSGNITIGTNILNINGPRNLFILKLDKDGNEIWVKQISSTNSLDLENLMKDQDNNIYFTGNVTSDISMFGNNFTGNGSYIAKFNDQGVLIWYKDFNTISINGLSINRNDELICSGGYSAGVTLGPNTLTHSGSGDGFLGKLFHPAFVELNSISNLGLQSVTINSTIGISGGSDITESGIVYSHLQNPTTLDNKIINESNLDTFASIINNLSTRTLYYVRSYVTNSLGTVYSYQNSFTTLTSDEDLAPNDGDGNGDGIKDSEQDNILSIYNHISESYMTLINDINIEFQEPLIEENSDVLFAYPFGKTEFKINATQAEVKIYYHGIESLDGYVYRKLFPDGTYKEFENVEFSSEIIGGNRVAVAILTLTDGGLGDYDGVVNGVIYDPGGPALPVSANIPFWDWWWGAIFLVGILLFVKIGI